MPSQSNEFEDVTFTIEVTMRRRWAAQFLGLLKRMHVNGQIGSSEMLAFYSDGDGDFRPRFMLDDTGWQVTPAEPGGDHTPTWDAG